MPKSRIWLKFKFRLISYLTELGSMVDVTVADVSLRLLKPDGVLDGVHGRANIVVGGVVGDVAMVTTRRSPEGGRG